MSIQAPEIPGPDQPLVPPNASWSFDIATAVLLALLLAGPIGSLGGAAMTTSMLLCCSLIMRSNLPRIALAAAFAAALGQVLLVSSPTPSIVVVPMIVYSVARWSTQAAARLGLLAGLVGSVVGPLRWLDSTGSGSGGEYNLFTSILPPLVISAFGCMAMVTAAYMLGRRRRDSVIARMQRQLAADERYRHFVAERTQADKIQSVNERQRIARELHDIVAHSLSVIVVQAEGGKAIAAKKPEIAPQVLETIAETGRDALVEMRRIVGLLRNGTDEEADTYVPSPGLDDLAELVHRTGNAQLLLRGALPMVTPTLGLTIYRIVQESLTNVLKHGGPSARAMVTLTTYPDRLEVTVADDGRGGATAPDGLGNGLRGMRERLSVHAGTLDARPGPGGGFVVRASVPREFGQPTRPWQVTAGPPGAGHQPSYPGAWQPPTPPAQPPHGLDLHHRGVA